jgi:predicted N-acetyltransferase YhbS
MNSQITLRDERPADCDAIHRITTAAFQNDAHSSHTEQFIVDALRRAGQLTLSLVAECDGEIVGHLALSPVAITSGATGWYGLGPLAVRPDRQHQGIGSMLATAALDALKQRGGHGCVVLGDPAYYGRFGFRPHAGLILPGVPPEYFQALAFGGAIPDGEVRYHAAFEATE